MLAVPSFQAASARPAGTSLLLITSTIGSTLWPRCVPWTFPSIPRGSIFVGFAKSFLCAGCMPHRLVALAPVPVNALAGHRLFEIALHPGASPPCPVFPLPACRQPTPCIWRCIIFLQFLDAHNIHWSVENPANSVLWELEPYQELIISHHKVDMQTCAFGGPRPTWKAFVTSLAGFRALGLRCPGNHEHASYGRKRLPSGQTHFATSEEAVYPRELCRQMVQLVSRELQIPLLELQTAPSQAHLFAAAAGRQARGHRRPLVLPEFQSVFTQDCPQLPPVDIKRRVLPNDLGLQPGIKLLSYSLKGVGDDKSFECRFGVYRSKEVFLQDALRAPHPFFDVLPLSDSSKRVTLQLADQGARLGRRFQSSDPQEMVLVGPRSSFRGDRLA